MARIETWYGKFTDFADTERSRTIFFRLHVPVLFFDEFKEGEKGDFTFHRTADGDVECEGKALPLRGMEFRTCEFRLSKNSLHLQVYTRELLIKEEGQGGDVTIEFLEGERFLGRLSRYFFMEALTQMFIQ
jgi:hypothetical protein